MNAILYCIVWVSCSEIPSINAAVLVPSHLLSVKPIFRNSYSHLEIEPQRKAKVKPRSNFRNKAAAERKKEKENSKEVIMW